MKRKSLLLVLLFALIAPWAAQAQTRETLTFDFEDQTIPSTWTNDATYPWVVTDAGQPGFNGTYCIMSTNAGNSSSTSTISATYTFLGNGSISFLGGCWGEGSSTAWDKCIFTIDGTQKFANGALAAWDTYSYVIEEGTHTFTWTYSKDGSVNPTVDAFFVDDIVIDLGVAPTCPRPTLESIDPQTIEVDQVSIRWEENGEATDWVIEYSTSSDFANATTLTRNGIPDMVIHDLTPATTYYVRVKSVCGAGDESSWSNSVSFTTLNPCAAPTNFVASNITASSATISWTAGYQETAWTVKYKKSSESSWDNATTVSVSETPTTSLTGLDGLTVYNVRVFNCTGENDPYLSGNFTTAASFPYSQDFSGSTSIPTGWSQYSGLLANVMAGTETLASSTYGWSNGTSNGVLDGNHLYSNIYSTGCKKWIVTPAIPVESGARLTFDVAYTAYSGTAANPQTTGTDDKFVVLASTDNMATWTILRQWDNAGSEFVLNELTPAALHQIFDLADYAGQNVIVAFYGESTVSNADNNIHVDNVVFELTPSCEKPMNLAVNYTGGLTAEVSWTSDATAWNMRVNGTPINGTITNPYTLTGLELATTYEVEVQANCGDATSEWAGPVSFTTDICMPENMCQITYELSDSYGDGWNGNYINVVDVETEAILATWTISSGNSAASGTLAICDGRAIQFQYVVSGTYSYPDENSWVIKDVNGEVIWEYSSPSASMSQDYTVSCVVTSCRKPTDLAATDIFGHSAKLSWTENGEATEWVIDYNGTTLTVNENPYVLEGLVPETAYTVKVKPVCDEEKWSDEITFTTAVACPAPTFEVEAAAESATITIAGEAETYNVRYRTPRGFNYGFEQAEAWTITDFDPCTVYDGDGGVTYGFSSWTFPNAGYTGACIAFNNDNSGSTNMYSHSGNAFGVMFNSSAGQSNDWFILPELAIENGYVFSFWGREITDQYGDETINVGIYGSTDGTFASLLAENVAVSTTEYTKFEYDLSEYAGQTIRLAINCVSNDIFGFMFDDIFVGNAEDDTWDYTYTEVNSPYEITGLTESTEYEVQVQANCGEDGVSDWSASVVFMTLPLCEVPTNVLVADITTNSAVVTWESEATSFDIEVNGEVTEDVTSPYTLNDLDPGTAYSVRVRANCGETGYSAWTTAVDFVTSCLAYELPYEYGFETADDMNCWSMMAASSANMFGVYTYDEAYEGSKVFVFSSYNNADYYDQILVSPELIAENDMAVEFYYRTTTGYGDGETFVVGYSTTTNDLSEFTWGEEISTTATEWQKFSATYPAGTKYVAVHYYANYQYYLVVDGFKFEEATGGQTLELSSGYNWVSINIEGNPDELLQALEEGLGDNATSIEGVNGMTEYLGDGFWMGELDDYGISNDQMYLIFVENDCTVELQGTPVDPTTVAITINPGPNWMGFPVSEETDIAEAFKNFAVENDMIEGADGMSEYLGDEIWMGFETLIPGQGYIYNSASEEVRTLFFSNGAKARHTNPNILLNINNFNKSELDQEQGMTKKQAVFIKSVEPK